MFFSPLLPFLHRPSFFLHPSFVFHPILLSSVYFLLFTLLCFSSTSSHFSSPLISSPFFPLLYCFFHLAFSFLFFALHFCFLHPSLFLSPCSAFFTLLLLLALLCFSLLLALFLDFPLFLHPNFVFHPILLSSLLLALHLTLVSLPPFPFPSPLISSPFFPLPFSISCLFLPYFLFFTLLSLFFASSSFSFTFLFLNLSFLCPCY